MKTTFLTSFALTIALGLALPTARAVSSTLVIAEVYGGGGNSGAIYRNDFVVLFNRGGTSQGLSGWSIQYTSATGSSWGNQKLNLPNASIPAGGYYLIQLASGGAIGADLPSPDATGTFNISATAGKIALVSSTTALTGTCPTGSEIVDLVGYGTTANCFEGTGPTPAPSNTTSVQRGSGGCTDTDNNSADFATGSPNPLNSASPARPCGESPVKILDINVGGGTVTITFTAAAGDSSASFDVVSSTTVAGTYTSMGALIISPSSGSFQATIAPAGDAQFYRIKRF